MLIRKLTNNLEALIDEKSAEITAAHEKEIENLGSLWKKAMEDQKALYECSRNNSIVDLSESGVDVAIIARSFGMSEEEIAIILESRRKAL